MSTKTQLKFSTTQDIVDKFDSLHALLPTETKVKTFEWLIQIGYEKYESMDIISNNVVVNQLNDIKNVSDKVLEAVTEILNKLSPAEVESILMSEPIQPQGEEISEPSTPLSVEISSTPKISDKILKYKELSLDTAIIKICGHNYIAFNAIPELDLKSKYSDSELLELRAKLNAHVADYSLELTELLSTYISDQRLIELFMPINGMALSRYLSLRFTKMGMSNEQINHSMWSYTLSELNEILATIPKYTAINGKIDISSPQMCLRVALQTAYSALFMYKAEGYTFTTI